MAVDTSTTAPLEEAPQPQPDPATGVGRRLLAGLLLPLIVVGAAGILRFTNLGYPERCFFDETYYYYDARDYLQQGVETSFAVHPPLGKWLIAGGLVLSGVPDGAPLDTAVTDEPGECNQEDNTAALAREEAESFARRTAAALFGTLTVGLIYLCGLRLFRRRAIAAVAALLLAVDGLAFTMSRIAMLDIFLGFFVLLGFWLLLLDRDEQWRGVPDADDPHRVELDADAPLPRRSHRYRWLAGVAFGLALATKWSALLAIGGAGLFVLASELAWRKRLTGRFFVRPGRIVGSGILTLLVVPAAVYVLSYIPWFANYEHTRPGDDGCAGPCHISDIAAGWVGEQRDIVVFHRDLDADHNYRAAATTWPLLLRPVAYYYENCNEEKQDEGDCVTQIGNVEEILGIGNPAIWWLALLAYPTLLWFGISRLDWRAWAIMAFLLAQYLPWLLAARTVFLFYMTPAVPFICLALAYLCDRASHQAGLRWIPSAVPVIAVAGFLFWYPILAAEEISLDAWNLRILLRSWI